MARTGDHDQSIADFTKAVEINPEYADAYWGRGCEWDAKGEYGKAISDFDQSLEINPDNHRVYNARGMTWEKKGDPDAAMDDFVRALEINPCYVKAYCNLKRIGSENRLKSDFDSDFKKKLERIYGIEIVTDFDENTDQCTSHSGQTHCFSIKKVSRLDMTDALQRLCKSLSFYSPDFVSKNLREVYLVGIIDKINGIKVGGIIGGFCRPDTSSVFVDFRMLGDGEEYPTEEEKSFHHEFSSILISKHYAKIPEQEITEWRNTNGPYFRYWNEETPTETDLENRKREMAQAPGPDLFDQGFVSPYCKTGIENDFNMFAQAYIAKPGRLNELADKYPPIKKKMKMVGEFYKMIGYTHPKQPICLK